jgi:OFA family oxalate/formate antiporter-like MFS transporter
LDSDLSTPPSGEDQRDSAPTAQQPPSVFYGWWVVVWATLASTIQTAVFSAGAQTLVLPLVREFGSSRAAVSVAFSLRRLEGGITGPLEGYLIHWFGARRYMMVGWVLFGLGFVGVGLSQSIYHFYVAFLLATLGQSVCGFLPIVTVLVNWFQRLRGRAIAIYQLGNSIGAALIPVLAWFVLNVGWRPTMIAIGVGVIVLGVPLAAVMTPFPEDRGLLPDGDEPPDEVETELTEGATAQTAGADEDTGLTVAQALRSRDFWFLGFSHSSSVTAWGALQVHLIPALTDIGESEQLAATILSLTLIIAAPGRLIGGFLGDKIGRRKVLVVAFLGQAMAVVLLAFTSTLTQALMFAVIFGVSFGARGTLLTVLRGDVFGRQNFSRLSGLMDPISSITVVISPVFAGWAYDVSGTYRDAFIVLALVNALGAALIFGIRIPDARASRKAARSE